MTAVWLGPQHLWPSVLHHLPRMLTGELHAYVHMLFRGKETEAQKNETISPSQPVAELESHLIA